MPRSRPTNVLLLLISSLLLGLFCAADSAAQDQPQLWEGVIELNQGLELEMTLRVFRGDDGQIAGAVDIPAQGFKDVAISDLEFGDGAMTFRLPFPGMQEELIPSFELQLSDDKQSASGTMAQAGQEFPVTFELRSQESITAAEIARRPQTPRPPFPYRQEEVRVPVEDNWAPSHVLAGTLTLPDAEEFGDGPYACAVLVTGSGPQDRDENLFDHKPFAVIADALARAGVATLRCDERGIGASTGDFAIADSHDFAADGLAQIRFAAARAEIDADRIGLIGHSEGGLTGAIIAAEHPDEVSFFAVLAGMGLTGEATLLGQSEAMISASGVPEDFIKKNRELQSVFYKRIIDGASEAEINGAMRTVVLHQLTLQPREYTEAEISQIVHQQMVTFGTPWMELLLVIDPADYFSKVTQPVLLMNGELDLQVLADENLGAITAALDRAGNEDVTVRRFDGLNHLFQNAQTGLMGEYDQLTETFDPGALGVLTSWVVERTSE